MQERPDNRDTTVLTKHTTGEQRYITGETMHNTRAKRGTPTRRHKRHTLACLTLTGWVTDWSD